MHADVQKELRLELERVESTAQRLDRQLAEKEEQCRQLRADFKCQEDDRGYLIKWVEPPAHHFLHYPYAHALVASRMAVDGSMCACTTPTTMHDQQCGGLSGSIQQMHHLLAPGSSQEVA
jgi:hypothetical protein